MEYLRRHARIVSLVICGILVVLLGKLTSAQTGTWTTKAPMPTARYGLAAGVVNGLIFAVGGVNGAYLPTVEAHNPATNTWTTRAPMPTARYGLATGAVNGILYAVGGINSSSILATVEAYDPATNTWTTKTPMPTARHNLAAGVVNGILYAVGGFGDAGHLATVEAYDPATNVWTTRAPMPTARYRLAAGVVNGILYAMGGCCDLATVEAYDPATNTWSTKAPMPTARSGLAAGVVNGLLYAIGGYNGNGNRNLATVEAYDPATNTWATKVPPMPTARLDLAAGVVTGTLYAVGGINGNSILATNEAFIGSTGINVQIDIEPGIFPNDIDLSSPGVLAVAILTTSNFNATDVAARTVQVAGAAPVQSTLQDVDGDGDLDMLLQFPIRRLTLKCASTLATLAGATKAEVPILGTDSVRVTRDRAGQLCS